ncbi:Glucosaminyl phosphatidylinositol (GlcN-PI) nositol acylation protein [Nowakowskiella sp. JEL0078]|nr:Glucosaminyl phosphatidylinositol (GlcN-PI) nositol acylation protein [Nowakowskiella sp. JEL0078]
MHGNGNATKELFYFGHHGSSLTEILVVFALLLAGYSLWLFLAPLMHPPRVLAAGQVPATIHFRVSILAYRAFLQLFTVFCILAVDFSFFPRRYAKTELYGISLMDLGVGCFIFSMGIVAGPKLYLNSQRSFLLKLFDSLKKSIPVLLLGFIRLVATKSVNYHVILEFFVFILEIHSFGQEHVSEYGQHWNFFFTLGFLPPIVILLVEFSRLFGSVNLLVLGTVVSAIYEYLLSIYLKDFILNAPRTTFLSQNKEAHCGNILLSPLNNTTRISKITIVFSGFITICTIVLNSDIFLVSRRMANLAYVILVVSLNLGLVLSFHAIHYFFTALKNATVLPPQIFRSINRNQLLTFLIANLITGAINLTLNTQEVSNFIGVFVVLTYLIIVSGLAVFIDVYLDWTLKI